MKKDKQIVTIVVGPDMTGKTQIAKALSQKLNIPYFKNENENFGDKKDFFINSLRYFAPPLASFIKQTGQSVIIDRGHPCEWVYSQVFKRETDMQALTQVDQAFADLGAIIIFCWRTKHLRDDDAHPDILNTSKLAELQEKYREFCRWTKCKVIPLCVDDEDLKREVDDILALTGLGTGEPKNLDFDAQAFCELLGANDVSGALDEYWSKR